MDYFTDMAEWERQNKEFLALVGQGDAPKAASKPSNKKDEE
jgi:hypothetical protein